MRILGQDLDFGENLDFWWKFGFLVEIGIFGENLDFWWKLRFLVKIWIFGENLDFWWKMGFLVKIGIFRENLDFSRKIFLGKNSKQNYLRFDKVAGCRFQLCFYRLQNCSIVFVGQVDNGRNNNRFLRINPLRSILHGIRDYFLEIVAAHLALHKC